jgi:SAM-dependent methyltransferase
MTNLPAAALRHLQLQRTHYDAQTDDELQSRFFEDVDAFAEELKPFLPAPRPNMRFIDIGCGIGFALLALLKIYGPRHRFVAVDRDAESQELVYGFSENPAAYNSLGMTREILTTAGIADDLIETVDMDREAFPDGSADIVTSTLAWGFHFPVETYLDEVAAVLAPGGVLVLDVRRGSGGEAALKKRFRLVHSHPDRKSDRLILTAS